MRYFELIESVYDSATDQSAPKLGDTRKPEITLKYLNRLKHIKKARIKEKKKKEKLYQIIYSQDDATLEIQQQNLEAAQMKNDQEKIKNDRLKLQNEKAKLANDGEHQEKIQSMALRALKQND